MKTVKITRKQAEPIIRAAFPEYKGRKVEVAFTDQVTFWDTNWSGGTRNVYRLVRYDGKTVSVPAPSPWSNHDGETVTLSPSFLIVEHTIACGKDLGITIYAHPSYAPKWLTG